MSPISSRIIAFIAGRRRSFGDAGRGVVLLVGSQRNAQIHLAATVLVIVAGFGLDIDRRDWALLAAAMALVWLGEALNTAVELLADAVSPAHHPLIGSAKDVAAGGVLLAAAAAVGIGLLVFTPYLAALCR
ncbi:MAG: diacylglycerol kinase family protein [Deltaproteobacteria bacterium]|nr:diacylglycerol kinase family protein [Candidatus Anaeroferrophillacea bacterium]